LDGGLRGREYAVATRLWRREGHIPPSGSKPGIAWFEWAFLSNYLVTPRILACPADEPVVTASSFDQFVQANFRANALSYTVALDTFAETERIGSALIGTCGLMVKGVVRVA
jgi:hypothetical protein